MNTFSQTPDVVYDVPLVGNVRNEDILLSTHVDSIQAMLLTFREHQGKGLAIKGRQISETGQILNIMSDELVGTFMKLRTEERQQVFDLTSQNMGMKIVRILFPVDKGANKEFPCEFYDTDSLVDKWLSSEVTPNHLLPVFGGATVHTLGSNVLNLAELEVVGDEMLAEIQLRQVGNSILLDS